MRTKRAVGYRTCRTPSHKCGDAAKHRRLTTIKNIQPRTFRKAANWSTLKVMSKSARNDDTAPLGSSAEDLVRSAFHDWGVEAQNISMATSWMLQAISMFLEGKERQHEHAWRGVGRQAALIRDATSAYLETLRSAPFSTAPGFSTALKYMEEARTLPIAASQSGAPHHVEMLLVVSELTREATLLSEYLDLVASDLKPPLGRPQNTEPQVLFERCATVYHWATRGWPSRTKDPELGEATHPLFHLVRAIVAASAPDRSAELTDYAFITGVSAARRAKDH
jgi:hypothetical protein